MQAISLEDQTGQTYLSTADFLRVGIPGSIATYCLIVSVGYALMKYANGW
jgi:phosphate transporter